LAEGIFEWTKSEEAATRRAAALAFVRLTDNAERVRPILMRMLLDSDPHVARQAALLLAEYTPAELPDLVKNLLMPRVHSPEESIQISAVAALSGMPEAAASERLTLIRMLASESSKMAVSRTLQYELAEALGSMGPVAKDAGPAILSLLERTHRRDPRIVAPIIALGKIGAGDQEVLNALLEMQNQGAFERTSVKLAIIESLGQLGGDSEVVLESLTELAQHERSIETRVAALRAIARLELDAETAELTFSSFLRNENVNIRVAACLLLVEKGRPEEIILDLAKLLKDTNYFVRILAANSLAELGPQARDAVPALNRAAEDRTNNLSANVSAVEDEEGEMNWDLFDGKLRELNRSSVQKAVRYALSAIGRATEGVKTAQLGRRSN
jgi:HEAT repeat protein